MGKGISSQHTISLPHHNPCYRELEALHSTRETPLPLPPLQAAGSFPRTRTKVALHHFASLILTRVQTLLSNSFHFSTTSQVFKQAVLQGRKKTSKLSFTQLLSYLNILRCFFVVVVGFIYSFIAVLLVNT